MRTLTRKLLSLLLAFTMVCAMVPAAMAADEGGTEGSINWNDPTCVGGDSHNPVKGATDPATCTETGTQHYTCNNPGCTATGTAVISALGHDFDSSKWESDGTKHWHPCKHSGCTARDSEASHSAGSNPAYTWTEAGHTYTCEECKKTATESHTWSNVEYTEEGHIRYCTVCDTSKAHPDKTGHDLAYRDITATTHTEYCETSNCSYVKENVLHTGDPCVCGYSSTAKLTADGNKISSTYKYDARVPLNVSNVSVSNGSLPASSGSYNISYDWNGDYYGASGSSAYLDTQVASAEVTCTVIATPTFAGGKTLYYDVTWSAKMDDSITVEVSVYNTGSYALGDEDIDGDDSVVDQIAEAVEDLTARDVSLYYVKFGTVNESRKGSLDAERNAKYYYDDDLENITFTAYDGYKGDVTFNFTAYADDRAESAFSGTVTFKVEEGTASAGDIIYPAKSGEDVEFDVNDFEDFWEDKYSKGSLDYVTFGSVSSSRGDLVDADGDKVSSRTKYYADPTSKQADLDGVTFEPGRNTKTTVTIDFTAHGTNNSKRDAELSGTVVILYTEKDPEAIVYSSTGKNITLDADDFLDNYKDTMGSSASNIQIQFLEVPSNGTLYYNYNERTEKGTELTSKNVANYTFSTSSRASRSIEDVTYVPDSRGRSDTVRFACYTSGGDLRYYGEVTFGQTVQNVTVNMTSTSSGVTFQASTFFNADDALLSANTISFGTPSSGTLYKNWNGTSGTRVTASDMFSYVASVTGNASISTVTYVPVAGYSGTVTIPFSAYGAAGGIVSGTVSIRVTATTPTTIFTDVPTTGSQAWAYPFINRLAAAGVVSGVTPTTYGPKQTVKWGEALKMVLLGAGHPAQVEGTGSNWASGYLTYAVNNGIVSNTNINLSSNITRLEMAELAAKALGMSPASRINTGIVGPTDTTNGYVYALYNAGIVGGDSSSGQNRYNGGSTLLRDEMAKIVCGVMDNA